MRYFLLVIIFAVTFLGCTVNKQPVFKKVDNFKVLSVSADTIRIKADAFFDNPNDVGGKISTDKIIVFANDVEVAHVFSKEFKVPASNNFQIPLVAKISTKKLLDTNKNGVLGGLLKSLLLRKVKIQLKGSLDYKVLGFKKEFLVDKTEEINIKF